MKKFLLLSIQISLIAFMAALLLSGLNLNAQPNKKRVVKNNKSEIFGRNQKEIEGNVAKVIQQQIEESISLYNDSLSQAKSLKSATAAAAISETDSLILVSLYNATNGDNWTNNTNWLNGPINTWHGITVVSDKVTKIELKKNNLEGTIPEVLGNLESLEYLDLDSNKISGTIPVELGNLTNLVLLYLNDNQLTGSIPEGLQQLVKLKWLNLRQNLLTGSIPDGLAALPLEFLDLSNNGLTGVIPGGLGQKTTLKWLNLGDNDLTGAIPVELEQFSVIEQLYLNGNQLTDTVPFNLGNLTKLKWLNLSVNKLSGSFPEGLGQLDSLELLYLNENLFTGAILVETGDFAKLEWLDLSKNQFEGNIPEGLGQLSNLKLLYLNENLLTGPIPAALGQLSLLQWLILSSNQLTGSLPEEIGLMTNLKYLNVEANLLDLLPDISAPDSLIDLVVSGNKLTFEDFEYNMDLISDVNFIYSPQDSIGENAAFTKNIGESFSYTLTTGGTQNNYQWYRNGVLLDSQISVILDFSSLTSGDAGTYYCEVTNDVVPGLTLTSKKISLQVNDTITLSFNAGWNIFSSTVMPGNADMENIFQTLIEDGQLKKVMDESGNTLENFGVFGGWKNGIVDLKRTEGYKINMISPATLDLMGSIASFPFEIQLNAGWNIISWPSANEQDALDVFQSLINSGTLKKVMDESGNVIENYGVFGDWKNFIGNLKPGEGYKVNVISASNLIINESGSKSEVILNKTVASTHFQPVFEGHGVDQMNINLVNLSESGIITGDEIGVFYENVCVGSGKVSDQNSTILNIIASAADNNNGEINGFMPGGEVILKLFRNGGEYLLPFTPVNNSSNIFEKNGSIFATVSTHLTTDVVMPENELEISFYPNPFNEFITIQINLKKRDNLTVEVYDLFSRRIVQLYNGSADGMLKINWDGNNSAGNRVAPGVYAIRVNSLVEKVLLNGK